MNNSAKPQLHGTALVNLLVSSDRASLLKDLSLKLKDIILNERQLCDLETLATGVFSPLEGFMVRADYESVLDRMRLQNNMLWPLPVCLDISENLAKSLDIGQSVALRDQEGFLLAVMHVEDIWKIERDKEAERIYKTNDTDHPGVSYLMQKSGDYYIGGKLEVVNLPIHFDFNYLRMPPQDVRSTCHKLDWKRTVGFITRQPIHRAQFEMTLRAMQNAKANLLLLPVVGMTKPGDFNHYVRVRCYNSVSKYYPPNTQLINLLPLAMRMAGPREAILHMIISRNFGCSHFIIGSDHASPGNDKAGKSYYAEDDAKKIAEKNSTELNLKIVSFEKMVYLPFEDEYQVLNEVPKDVQTLNLSGSDIQNRIRAGKKVPEWATFPEVMDELLKAFPHPRQQGFTVFLTGLSGAGKSTVAKVLYSRLMEIGDRPVTLLDGDIVRLNLSNLLGFSKEHRDINVRRIGFVASEITKNRGIAICAPIAPYESTRQEIREKIEHYGGFIEVHVATPIEVCEKRDRKGMYAKARAGIIKGFTGVDDPYEIPQSPEVGVDTTDITPNDAVQEILIYLSRKGYI